MFKRMTASQKRGVLVLLAVVAAIVGWQWRSAQLGREKSLPDGAEEVEMTGKRSYGEAQNGKSGKSSGKKYADRPAVRVELNGADTTELMRVRGIGPTFARRIVKYRRLIGGFQSVDDLRQVYGIDSERFAGIAPQVFVEPGAAPPVLSEETADAVVPRQEDTVAAPQEDIVTAPPAPVNINTADSAALDAVSGIGPKTARTILKYRQRIYYFHSLDQLSEVWGIRPENLERMRGGLTVGDQLDAYPHLRVNGDSKEELARHGYVGYKEAGLIVAYREQHGNYTSLEDLQQIRALEADFWEKVEPYLQF